MKLPPDREIDRRLRAILDSAEFHRRFSDRVTELLRQGLTALLQWLRTLGPAERWALLGVCFALLAAIGVQVALLLRGARALPRTPRAGAVAWGDDPLDPARLAWWAFALAEEGRYREAARALQQALLVRLARERGLPWRPELSDWEWVSALGDPAGLCELTRATERVAYGAGANAAGFEGCAGIYQRATAR